MRAKQLEDRFLRPIFSFILRLILRVEVRGVENFYAAGDRVLIVCNHVSFLDPLLLGVFIPQKPAFAINIYQADKWYFRWLDKITKLYKLDPTKAMTMKSLISDLRKSGHVVVFPEGRISTSGGIMKIYDGAVMIVEKSGATVLPIRIDGAEYSKVSRLGRKLRQRWFPKIRLTFLPPKQFAPGEVTADRFYDVMAQAALDTTHTRQPIVGAFLEAYRWHGGAHGVAEDIARVTMTYRQLFTRAFVLSGKLQEILSSCGARSASAGSIARGKLDPALPQGGTQDDGEKYVGVMLPSAIAPMVTFTALHMLGKIPCMLNFSAGETNILHACRIAQVKTVLTSRTFIEKGKLENVAAAIAREHTLVYLEDIRPSITLKDKLDGLYQAYFAESALEEVLETTSPDDPAVILYTSGSEGTPKGVALSHANILSNIAQARARLDLTPADKLFNALPVFHSFGLTVGMIMPVVAGIRTFLYPTPLHYRIIPELVYDTDATIMLGTDTFYNGYAHYAHPYDFWNIRLAVSGAEKLKESTRRLYSDRFRVNIVEGYGVTEASPILSVNTPMQHKEGTVGRVLPAIECRLEPVPGMEKGGRLHVKGPNIMLGYLKGDQPGVIQHQGDWYDTGDIADIDEGDYITILGRAKRFAKIAGEMVSLQAVEDLANALMPESAHAAIAVSDDRKGEQIILYSESKDLARDALLKFGREKGIAEIAMPKQVLHIETLPRLGTGKLDYPALSKLHKGDS